MMVGYVWPVDTTSETGYEVGDPKDISNDAINAKLPVYVPYNDPFNNNMNVFDINNGRFGNYPVETIDSPGPVWTTNTSIVDSETVHIDSDGFYTINDLGTWKNWGNIVAVLIFKDATWMDEIDMDDSGGVADFVVYYPKTDKMYYRADGGGSTWLSVESHRIAFSAHWHLEDTDQVLYYTYYYIEGYADLTKGFKLGTYCDWFNGYDNKGFNMVLSTVDSNLIDFVYIHDPYEDVDTQISVWISSNTINLTIYRNNVEYDAVSLGSYTVYDKVLLTVDYDSATIALSGLRGMDSFNGDYANAIRETVSLDWRDPVIFQSISVQSTSGSNAAWYMADTLSAVAETDGSHNYSMDLRDYTANGSCQLNIRNVTQHGDMIEFRINSHYVQPTIQKGMITVLDYDGNLFTVPVNNLLVAIMGNSFYINGHLVYTSNSITEAKIIFHGDWKMSLVYYPVTEKTVPGFEWLPGSFGLDENGYCVVGIITSALTGLGASLYGRRNGAKMALVTFVSGMIGVVYLLILMGGL